MKRFITRFDVENATNKYFNRKGIVCLNITDINGIVDYYWDKTTKSLIR